MFYFVEFPCNTETDFISSVIDLYNELVNYMEANNFSQKDIAEKLGVSNAYVSQILNGNFNFTLKKLIEISLMMGKVPQLEFVDIDKYDFNHAMSKPEKTGRIERGMAA